MNKSNTVINSKLSEAVKSKAKENNMLSSTDINWEYGMTIAIVKNGNIRPRIQSNMLLSYKNEIFTTYGEWINQEQFYIVYRY